MIQRDNKQHKANRLARETSPYLLQHAHNPVDWYPWGPEAFAEARKRGVPIFLSIGYSTCYWCHVMERETFEDASLARIMNEKFVNIKVDREERPDVDDVYMTATQVLSGRGGWPMSSFLEPTNLRPFWCGTYFPPEPRMGMPGFGQILNSISEAWQTRQSEVEDQAKHVGDAVTEYLAARQAPVALGISQVTKAAQALLQMLDRTWGGFGNAPKFPQPVFLEYLLDVRTSAGDESTRDAVDHALRLTLDKMAIGGMRDQVGGGFHRYSVDQTWTVPHFEKMLYDNAQLAAIYARAAAIYSDDYYRFIAENTAAYVRLELATREGAFASAQDAEVDGREGLNYVWSEPEIRAALSPEDAEFALKVYSLDRGPNFKDPHHEDAQPVNILRLDDRPDTLAQRLGVSPREFQERLGRINCKLYGVRATRKQPRLDDKILASWNGMMVAALANISRLLEKPERLTSAEQAMNFLSTRMHGKDGLMRSSRGGESKTTGFLEDYAWVIAGLLALEKAEAQIPAGVEHEGPALTTPDESRHLALARTLAEEAERFFGDASTGGYFDTRAQQSDLFVRPRTTHDGAIPSGSSVMLHNLLDLFELTRDTKFLDRALAVAAALSPHIAQSAVSSINATRAVLRMLTLGLQDRLAALGPAAAEPSAAGDFTPVEVYADKERISLGPDMPAQVQIRMKIADGYHITAADPGKGGHGLMPLRVHIINGSGVEAYADYPKGEPYGTDGDLRIHRNELAFPVAVELKGDWRGQPLLAITFQACTDTECMEPTTVELDVAIDR